MGKKLPDIFANPIDKKMDNTQELFYGTNEERKVDSRSVEQKITSIFASKDFVYKSKVRLTLKNESRIVTLVGMTDKSLLTLDNETILISDIMDIEQI